jgi:hypothetical protein
MLAVSLEHPLKRLGSLQVVMASDEKVSTMRGVGYRVYFLVMHWQLAP